MLSIALKQGFDFNVLIDDHAKRRIVLRQIYEEGKLQQRIDDFVKGVAPVNPDAKVHVVWIGK